MLIIILLLWNTLYFVGINYLILDRISKNYDTPFYFYLVPILFLLNIYYIFKTGYWDISLQTKQKIEREIKDDEAKNTLSSEIKKQKVENRKTIKMK